MFFTILECSFHHVVPATTLVVATCGGNGVSNLVGKGFVAFFRVEAVHAGEVPRNLQVVTHNAACLVNPPLQIVRPILIELFVHEGAVAIIREVLTNRVEGIFQELGIALFSGGEIEVDQVSRCVVTN